MSVRPTPGSASDMIIKVVLIFLVVMALLGVFGRMRLPRLLSSKKCPKCGRPRIGKGPCPCGKDT